MISDEEGLEPIDFTWFFFVGVNKLGLPPKAVGRLTIRTFFKLFQHYKDMFDAELALTRLQKTFREAEAEHYRSEADW